MTKQNLPSYAKIGLLCYDAFSNKRFIKPGETIEFKYIFIKGQDYLESTFDNGAIGIWLVDANKNYWYQGLDVANNALSNSNKYTRKDFFDAKDMDYAIKCFSGEAYW